MKLRIYIPISVTYLFYILHFFLISTFSAHASDNSNTEHTIESLFNQEEVDWVKKNGTLKYVYDPDWAPFEWTNEIGKHSGIIADIMQLIEKRSSLKLIPVHTDTWNESVELVKNREVDMFSAITVTNQRKAYLNFTSKDIYTYPAVLVTKFRDKMVYLDMKSDFKGQRIGIVKGSGLGQYIKENFPQYTYIELSSTRDGFNYLRNNKIDKFAINTVTAKYYIEKKGFDDLKIALKLDYTYHLKIAIHKALPQEIISILDKTLSSIEENEFNKIFYKWTEKAVEQRTDWSVIFQVSGVLFVAILFLIWSNRGLNLLVEKRTSELNKKNSDLEDALKEIKILHGIIPICSYCHSIRDDKGAWDQLEAYISKHSDATFSHGICPQCYSKVRDDKS